MFHRKQLPILAHQDERKCNYLFYDSSNLEVFQAKTVPPQSTRAKLRGDFIRAAQIANKDISVDWVHLKMNDQTQRTVLCKDPFANVDERVEQLIASM